MKTDWPAQKKRLRSIAEAMSDDELDEAISKAAFAVAVCDRSVLKQRDRERNLLCKVREEREAKDETGA